MNEALELQDIESGVESAGDRPNFPLVDVLDFKALCIKNNILI